MRIYTGEPAIIELFDEFDQDLIREMLIVSQLELKKKEGEDTEIVVERAEGEKCARCWHYSTDTETRGEFENICERCYRILAG